MKVSVELSLYPLSEDYKERIISFIERLKEHNDIDVLVNGMSTQLFGDYDTVMNVLKNELKPQLENHRTMAVIKMGDGELRPEKIPDHLK